MYELEIGDYVHARFYSSDRTSVATQNFLVSAIDGTIYAGGALDCDTANGWSIELLRKARRNLHLPTELSEITVFDKKDNKTYLTGKEPKWRTENGNLYTIDNVVRWEEGHV